jgi:uncharacterized spore protein YtfJ
VVLDTIRQAVESATVTSVFGEPINRGDVTVIPVARVHGRGGGGGGGQATGDRPGGGSGAGMALSAKPVGVFVVKNGKVGWRPAVDPTKLILGSQAVAITALLTIRALRKARRR